MKLKNLFKLLAAGSAVFSISMVSGVSAFAQAGGDCSCVVPAGSIGQIIASSGDVQVSQATGFGSAGPGTPLSQGSRIIVGLGSEADMTLGSCRLRIPQNNDVLLDPSNGGICVRAQPANGQTAGGGNGVNPVAIIAGGAAVVGGFVALAVSDSDSVSD